MSILRIFGGLLALGGLVLIFAPTLAYDPGPPPDAFAAVERRIPWGALLGFGLLLVFRTRLMPWAATVASFVLWMVVGVIIARLAGMALDGAGGGKQWMWVGVEAVVAGIAGAYLYHKSKSGGNEEGGSPRVRTGEAGAPDH
jgi:cell division protein FtsW (lipid II flippase)